jgi:hypothetical protein
MSASQGSSPTVYGNHAWDLFGVSRQLGARYRPQSSLGMWQINRPVAGSKFKARPRAARWEASWGGAGGTVQIGDLRWRPDLITGACHSRSAPLVHMNKPTPAHIRTRRGARCGAGNM